MLENRENWAGNYTYGATALHAPETVAEVQALVRHAGKVRALGSRHSFNAIADSPGTLISLARFDHTPVVDATRRTVTIDGGSRYGQFSGALHQAGFALHNLASLPHISVAGACATATHGSGVAHGNLATAVTALDVVTAGGTLRHISREDDPEELAGAVVGLGGLGVVTSLTLDVVPAFDVRQEVYENLPLAQLRCTLRRHHGRRLQRQSVRRLAGCAIADGLGEAPCTAGPSLCPARRLLRRHPRAGRSPPDHPPLRRVVHTADGRPRALAPAAATLPHGLHAERGRRAPDGVLRALRAWARCHPRDLCPGPAYRAATPRLRGSHGRRRRPLDEPCYRQASVAIHFTWKKDWKAVQRLLPAISSPGGASPRNPRPTRASSSPCRPPRSRPAIPGSRISAPPAI